MCEPHVLISQQQVKNEASCPGPLRLRESNGRGGPRPGGLALRLRDSWGTEVRGWASLALAAWAEICLSS
jgi:hypothetical protein